jgi:hypothetical protein
MKMKTTLPKPSQPASHACKATMKSTLKGNARALVNLREKEWWVDRLKALKNKHFKT